MIAIKTYPLKKRALSLAGIISLSLFLGCAHDVDPIALSSTTQPDEEIRQQTSDVKEAYQNQVDVLAAEPLSKAEKYLSNAEEKYDSGDNYDKVLETLSYSKAYLSKANQDADAVRPHVREVIESRKAALVAGARNISDRLGEIDDDLRDYTNDRDSIADVESQDKVALQSRYLDLELAAIKAAHLKETKQLLEQAENKGGDDVVPKSYDQAVHKFKIAEKLIETDRHNEDEIRQASQDANKEARRVLVLIDSAQRSKNQTPEQRATLLLDKKNEAQAAEQEARQSEFEVSQKQELINRQNLALSNTVDQNESLQNKLLSEQMVINAASLFSKDEAEVYQQDGRLIIRLKKMNFKSGQSELPTDSLALLAKVKDVIKDLDAQEVMVQGHTDAVGSPSLNQKLSQQRALTVAEFLKTSGDLDTKNIESKGFGYSNPLASNKTKEGRAQNRRVDIAIKTRDTNLIE